MYIDISTIPESVGLKGQLLAAGIPVTVVGYGTRRIVDGSVVKGQPLAVHLAGLDESYRAAAEAVIAAHTPNFGHVAAKIAETKREAATRIEAVAPIWRQINALRKSGPSSAIFMAIDAIRAASDAKEAEILLLTDGQAGNYDVTTGWPNG